MGIIISITTVPRRYKYFLSALRSISVQKYISKVDKVIVNIDDNLSYDDKDMYNEKELSSSCGFTDWMIELKERPAKWKSANKLIWTYKEHPDDIIVCFDDDGIYDSDCLSQLIDAYYENSGCIICQQTNPVVIDRSRNRVEYIDFIDVKLKQRGFSKYFSHACLFPPDCFSDILFDYDAFKYTTDCNHDELWFWLASTLKGTKVVCLDNLGYFHFDYGEEICANETKDGLGIQYNGNSNNIKRYNDNINELFGTALIDVLDRNGVVFNITKGNSYATYVSISFINQIYYGWNIIFLFDVDVSSSWVGCISDSISSMSWDGSVKVLKNDGKM